MDAKRRIGERVRHVLGVLEAFSLRLRDGAQINIDIDAVAGLADSGHLPSDLAALFVELGQVARDHDSGVLLTSTSCTTWTFPPSPPSSSGRTGPLSVTVAGAGCRPWPRRPATPRPTPSGCSPYPRSAPSPPTWQPRPWWCRPPTRGWPGTAGPSSRCRITACYPYLIQEFGKAAWDVADGPDAITVGDVQWAIPLAVAQLDDGFFRVRVSRSSDGERHYLGAMAEQSDSVTESRLVADLLGTTTQALAPVRDNLMR